MNLKFKYLKLKIILTAIICYTTLSFSQIDKTGIKKPEPFVLGIIDEIQSTVLDEKRILNIYLPEDYYTNDTIKYPVVYLLDGSANEDFIHIVGLYQFDSFSWVDRVQNSIIVGIANVDRKRDFTFPTTIEEDKKNYPTTGGSKKFINFIENELQPYIQNKYRTNLSKTIIGQSLGGLLSTEILLKKPKLFNKYIIVSPSLWWDNGSLLNLKPAPITSFTEIYIGVGKEGLTPTEIPRVMEVDANLLAEKIKNLDNKNVNIYFDYLPEEDHATVFHQAVYNALKIFSLKEKKY